MVRHYKCKGKDPKYTQEMFDTVQDMLKDGMSIRGVSKLFNIPYTTVNRWANNPNMTIGAGHPTVLTKAQEELIVIALETLASWGHSQDRDQLKDMVQSFVLETGLQNPFVDGRPGHR